MIPENNNYIDRFSPRTDMMMGRIGWWATTTTAGDTASRVPTWGGSWWTMGSVWMFRARMRVVVTSLSVRSTSQVFPSVSGPSFTGTGAGWETPASGFSALTKRGLRTAAPQWGSGRTGQWEESVSVLFLHLYVFRPSWSLPPFLSRCLHIPGSKEKQQIRLQTSWRAKLPLLLGLGSQLRSKLDDLWEVLGGQQRNRILQSGRLQSQHLRWGSSLHGTDEGLEHGRQGLADWLDSEAGMFQWRTGLLWQGNLGLHCSTLFPMGNVLDWDQVYTGDALHFSRTYRYLFLLYR